VFGFGESELYHAGKKRKHAYLGGIRRSEPFETRVAALTNELGHKKLALDNLLLACDRLSGFVRRFIDAS
jgi:hypothetical protein